MDSSSTSNQDSAPLNTDRLPGMAVLSRNQASSVVATHSVTVTNNAVPAAPDAATVTEVGTATIAVLANDGTGAAIATVNGATLASGGTVALASGAVVTLNPDGTLGYDPAHAFDYLNGQSSAVDRFSYTLVGGNAATVSVTVTGLPSATDAPRGSTGDDTIVGNPTVGTIYNVAQGGTDSVTGGSGSDVFLLGGTLTAADRIDGGAGSDQLGLQGDYTGANRLVLGANTLVGIETIVALAGYSYDIVTDNANVAAGQTMTVSAAQLQTGNAFTFNGSAETDGSFIVYGGLGIDNITTGAGNDAIYFGRGYRFGPSDHVDGGAGTDQLALAGTFTGTISGTQVVNIETLALLDDTTPAVYTITLADDWALPGETRTINFNTLRAGATVDGHLETSASFIFYGGSGDDVVTGGGGNDTLYGGRGADTLTGGAGADTFAYTRATHSIGSSHDIIVGFDAQVDRIDLPFTVAFVDPAITGSATAATLDAALGAALGNLAAYHAVQFTVTDGGALDNHIFEVIDANGVLGYQAGEDMVIELQAPVHTIVDTAPFM